MSEHSRKDQLRFKKVNWTFLFSPQFKHDYDVFRNSSVKRFIQIPLLSTGIKFECTNVLWEPKMLIGGLNHASMISSSVVGVGSLIDGSQNVVCPWRLKMNSAELRKSQ